MVECSLGTCSPHETCGVINPLSHHEAVWFDVVLGEDTLKQLATRIDAAPRGQLLVAWVDRHSGMRGSFLSDVALVMYPPLFWLLVAGVGVADTLGFLGVMSEGSLSIFLLLEVEEGKKMI